MEPFDKAWIAVLVVGAAALVVGTIGLDPAGIATAVPAFAGIDVIALQVLEDLSRLLDKIADFLSQLNRVVSEFAQLFGEGGGEG